MNKKRIGTSIICLILLIVSMVALSACGGKVNNFKLSFKVDSDVYQTITTNGKDGITIPENPTKTGYEFDGWYWDKDVWSKPFTANSLLDAPISSDMSVYAKFDAIGYDIIYNNDGGEHSNPTGYTVEDSFVLEDASKKGYTFIGWFSDVLFANEVTQIEVGTTGNKELFAKFIINQYDITFDSTGGSVVETITQDFNTIVSEPQEPTKLGYEFIGWYEENSQKEYVFNKIEARNVALIARWDILTYDIEYHLDNGTNGINPNSYTVEDSFVLEDATKTGYTFMGWFSDALFANEVTQIDVGTTGDLELYAKFEIINYAINYHFDSTKGQISTSANPTSYTILEEVVLADLINIQAGYNFDGWYDAETNGNKVSKISVGTTGTKDIYARFSLIEYTITPHNTQDVIANIPSTYTIEDNNILLSGISKDGYTFKGWFTAETGGEQIAQIITADAKNIDIYAQWSIIDYTATFKADGIQVGEVLTFNVENMSIIEPSVPHKAGYTGEWEDYSLILDDITINADYTVIVYTITYNVVGEYDIDEVVNNNVKTYTVESEDIMLLTPSKSGYNFVKWTENGNEITTIEQGTIGNKTITAVWEVITYTITYNVVGEYDIDEVVNNNVKTYTVESEDIMLLTPSKSGYNFVKWTENGNEITTIEQGTIGNKTITAKWQIINYSISYNLDGGAATNLGTYTVKDILTLSQPRKTGYIFAGWIGTDITTANKFVTIEKGSIGNRSYTATWTANEYAVTYNANGGILDKSSVTAIYDSYFTLATVTREGYTFEGWYSGTNKFTSGIWKTTEPVSLKAKWTANTYKIFYDVNGGELADTQQSVIYDKDYSLSEPTRTGYTFVCWLYNGEEFNAGIWTIANNVTLTAKWDANKYIVIYDANDGVCDTEKDVITYDTTYGVPTPTRVGYTFNGWYYKGTEYFGGKWTTAEDITLTAEWIAHTNIPYIVNHHLENVDGSGYSLEESQDFTGTSNSFVTPSTNTYTGFTSPVEQRVKVNPNGSLVVDYLYTRNSYTITFVTNGGTAVANQTYKYQEELNLPETERYGVTFGGWFTTQMLVSKFSNETMPASNKTVYAWWQEESKPSEFTYKGTEEITITGYMGSSTTMSIPMYIGDKPVTTIDASAFENKTSLLKVVVPESITSIGIGAFKGCNSIEEITLPFVGASVDATYYNAVFGYIFGYKSIHEGSTNSSTTTPSYEYENIYIGTKPDGTIFQYTCRDYYYPGASIKYRYKQSYYYYIPVTIMNVTITSQTNIPVAAFNNCDFIETITLSADVENIGDYAFQNCKSLISFNSTEIGVFNIPENVTNINNYAFYGCEKATTVTLGNNVSNIGNYAFSGCVNINKFNSENEYEFILPAKVVNIGKYAFQDVQTIKKVVVPDSVTSIGLGAFKGCNSIEDITLPFVGASVDATYYDAVFGYIFGYKSIHATSSNGLYLPTKPSYEYENSSVGTKPEDTILQYTCCDYFYPGASVKYYYMQSYYFYIPANIRNVTITAQTNIPVAAFNNCDFIETITLSADVENIGDYAFQNCNATILYK